MFPDHWHWDFLHLSLVLQCILYKSRSMEGAHRWLRTWIHMAPFLKPWVACCLDFLAGAPFNYMQLALFLPDQFTKVIKKTLFDFSFSHVWSTSVCLICWSHISLLQLRLMEIWLFNILYRFKASIHISSLTSILLHPFYCSILHMYT